MHVLLAGGTGLLGRALFDALRDRGHAVHVLGRSKKKIRQTFAHDPDVGDCAWTWDDLDGGHVAWLGHYDAVINLAGANLADQRWNSSFKETLRESRVSTTTCLAKACASLGRHAPRLLNASAVGVFSGHQGVVADESVTPEPTESFLGALGQAWEAALAPAVDAGLPVVILRFGVVLTPEGGALAAMLPAYRRGLGGPLGGGHQCMTWVSLDDAVGAVLHVLEDTTVLGPVHVVAEQPVEQRELAKTLARVLGQPCWLRMPAWLVTLMFGEMGRALLLSSRQVQGQALTASGYTFQHPTLHEALSAMLVKDSTS